MARAGWLELGCRAVGWLGAGKRLKSLYLNGHLFERLLLCGSLGGECPSTASNFEIISHQKFGVWSVFTVILLMKFKTLLVHY
jgi:hypothetical protein